MSFATITSEIKNDFNPITRVYVAGAVIDPDGVVHRPGAVAARRPNVHAAGRALAWGPAETILRKHPYCEVERRPDTVLMPGLINSHSHLELTNVGPQPYAGDFVSWLSGIRTGREQDWNGGDQSAVRYVSGQVAEEGIEGFGDIQTMRERLDDYLMLSSIRRVAFAEVFGLGPPFDASGMARIADLDAIGRDWRQAKAMFPARLESGTRGRRPHRVVERCVDFNIPFLPVGLSPHAPYSAGPTLYAAASEAGRLGVPVCTHLAETLDEARFVARGDGPFLELLKSIGKWDASFAKFYGQGLSPVRWMEPYLRQTRWLVAHCNYVDDEDLRLLAETGTSVAYCPIASAYFGHEDHRYRDMLRAGINVCLGTDSIVCQPPDEPQPQSVLPQMRFLYCRDGTDPGVLFRMASINGRRALRLDDVVQTLLAVRFDASDATGPLVQVLRGQAPGRGIAL